LVLRIELREVQAGMTFNKFMAMLVLGVVGSIAYQWFEPAGILLLCSAAHASWYAEPR
jgi:hypothetical protein